MEYDTGSLLSLTFEEQLLLCKPIPITEVKICSMIESLQTYHTTLLGEADFKVERQRCCIEINKLIASLEYLKGKVHNRDESLKDN
jgi:hypothetical protein